MRSAISSASMKTPAGGEHSPAEDQLICPTREDAAIVYRFLSSQGGFPHGPELLYQRLMASGIGYGKMLVALDALMELGLIAREKTWVPAAAGSWKSRSDERAGHPAAE